MRSSLMLLSLVMLAGCPEPVPSEGVAVDGAPPAGTAPPPGSNAPPPTDGVGVVAPSEEVQVEPGTGVVISGTFTYTGDAKGAYRVDISAQKTSGPSVLIAKAVVPAQGPWQVEVPKNAGPIVVMAFIEQGHGPGGGTPTATVYGLTVGESPITGVTLAPAAGGAVTGTPPGPAAGAGAPAPGADAAAATPPADAAPAADAAPDATLPPGTDVSAPAASTAAKPGTTAAPAASPATASPAAKPATTAAPAASTAAKPATTAAPAAKPATTAAPAAPATVKPATTAAPATAKPATPAPK